MTAARDFDPSWKQQPQYRRAVATKPPRAPWVCADCGGHHQYRGHDGRMYDCGFHCKRHATSGKE